MIIFAFLSIWAQRVKLLPAMWETQVRSLGQENPLEKEMATTPVYGALWATADGVKSQTQFSD